jgi:hypothetical protein
MSGFTLVTVMVRGPYRGYAKRSKRCELALTSSGCDILSEPVVES